jgi:hypothetical protein
MPLAPHNNLIEPTRLNVASASRVCRLWRAAHQERYAA